LDGHRHMWWNFVSSSRDRIEQAKQDWLDGRFGTLTATHLSHGGQACSAPVKRSGPIVPIGPPPGRERP
nr:hypothetical protein [Pseudomonadota bacterium]